MPRRERDVHVLRIELDSASEAEAVRAALDNPTRVLIIEAVETKDY